MNLQSNLKETAARKGDLVDMFLPIISVDEFEPKIGKSVQIIVSAFYFYDENAAEDFRAFLERGTIKMLDAEVSPNPDEYGHWLVFVEFRRNKKFWDKIDFAVEEAERLTGNKLDWDYRPYFGNKKLFKRKDPKLLDMIVLEPADYIIRRKHKLEGTDDMNESLSNFFKDAYSMKYKIQEGTLILEYRMGGRYFHKKEKLYFGSYELGDTGKLLENEIPKAVEMGYLPREVVVLGHMLGNPYVVNSTKDSIYVENGDNILILRKYE